MDPTRPLDVVVQVESPHVAQYRLFVRPADQAAFTAFASGTDLTSGQAHAVGPLPRGSEIGLAFDVGGNPRTAYRVRLSCVQDGDPVPGATTVVSGTTDENGADSATGRVTVS